MLSSFTHPQVVLNRYAFLCSVEHKGRYFEECWSPLPSIVWKKKYESKMGQPVTHMRLTNGKPQQVNEPINS